MTEQTVATGFARALLQLAVSKGASEDLLLATSGIDPKLLQDQDNRLPLAAYAALMRAGQKLCGEPALALHFGETFDLGELSIVGLIAGAAQTFAEAFEQMNRFARLAIEVGGVGEGERYVLSRRDGELWLVDTRAVDNEFPELTESSFARMVCTGRRMLGGSPFVKAVHVTHAAPPYRAEYARVFQVPVVFGSDKNALLMSGDLWLSRKAPAPSKYVFGILSERATALLKDLEQSKSATGRVKSVLMPILHTGKANMEMVAAKLGISRQILHRNLKAEGTTFEKVLEDLRRALAVHYLTDKKVSVNETAYLVGFSDPAAFSRAFKRWTGIRPGKQRAN